MGMIQQSTNWVDCWVVRCLRRRSAHMNSSWLVFAEWRMICPTWWRTMQEAKQMNLNEAPIMSIFRLTNGGLIAIKMNLHSPNSQLRRIRSWWPLCNKICMVEMVQFLWKYGKSDQTKRQDGRGWCCGEGDCGGAGVITALAEIEVMWWRRRKFSWIRVNTIP